MEFVPTCQGYDLRMCFNFNPERTAPETINPNPYLNPPPKSASKIRLQILSAKKSAPGLTKSKHARGCKP